VELSFLIKFSLSRKLSGYDFPAISKQRDVRHNNMKPKNTVIIILSLFLFSCEQKYSIRDNQVYLKGWNEGSGNYERLVEKADAKTFQKIENDENLTIGKDNKYVFF